MSEIRFCGSEFGEEALLGLELARVNAAAASLHANRMFEVEHLVVEEILDSATRRVRPIEDAADDDRVVRGIVVTQHAAGMMSRPRQSRPSEKSMKETRVEGVEDLVEIEVMANRSEDSLAAAGLANVFGLFRDGLGRHMAPVAVGVKAGDWLLVKLGEEDVGDRMMD